MSPRVIAADGVRVLSPSEARRAPFDLVTIAASAGGVTAVGSLLGALPSDFPVPIAIVQHRSSHQPNVLPRVLGYRAPGRDIHVARHDERIRPGVVYVAPPDLHLVVRADHCFALHDGRRIDHVRSSANRLFETAADALGPRLIAVVLTGGGSDATNGVLAVKAHGGVVIAQDPGSAEHAGMPHSAIASGAVDHVLPLSDIAPMLVRLAGGGAGAG